MQNNRFCTLILCAYLVRLFPDNPNICSWLPFQAEYSAVEDNLVNVPASGDLPLVNVGLFEPAEAIPSLFVMKETYSLQLTLGLVVHCFSDPYIFGGTLEIYQQWKYSNGS
mgnify:CR=1 FL=1